MTFKKFLAELSNIFEVSKIDPKKKNNFFKKLGLPYTTVGYSFN